MARHSIGALLERVVSLFPSREFVIYPKLTSAEDAADALYRASFYFRDRKIYYAASRDLEVARPSYFAQDFELSPHLVRVSTARLLWKILTLDNVLLTASGGSCAVIRRFVRLSNVNYVDRRVHNGEALDHYHAYNHVAEPPSEAARYLNLADVPKRQAAFVFGSGPSLGQAYQYDFRHVPSYRIICNTIVKNRRLLDHIRPQFIVCADAAFHFGPSVYASTFRRDLVAYLQDNPDCKLLIPEDYYWFFREHVYAGENLYTIPCLRDRRINMDLRSLYAVHRHGTILNRLQLPLASSLSDTVVLLGFDGRSKDDQARGNKYWTSHAEDSNYPTLMDTVHDSHPHIRGIDKDTYASAIAELTEEVLASGERLGNNYYCVTDSNVAALQKRRIPDALRATILPDAAQGPAGGTTGESAGLGVQ